LDEGIAYLLETVSGREDPDMRKRAPLRERKPGSSTWIGVEQARKIIALLDSGEWTEEVIAEIIAIGSEYAASVNWTSARDVALTLLDFLWHRDEQSARELRGMLDRRARNDEERLVRDSASERLGEAMEDLGISERQLASFVGVQLATVRRWRRGGGCNNGTVPTIAEIHYHLKQRGLGREEMRAWMDTPNPRIGWTTPRKALFGHWDPWLLARTLFDPEDEEA